MMRMFREICVAVKEMHTYKAKGGARAMYEPSQVITTEDESRQDEALLSRNPQDDSTGDQVALGKRGEMVPWAHRDIKPG